jgi:protoporphyrinogen oxidase
MWPIRCWPQAMPQYTLGHLDQLAVIDKRLAATLACTWQAMAIVASASPTALRREKRQLKRPQLLS